MVRTLSAWGSNEVGTRGELKTPQMFTQESQLQSGGKDALRVKTGNSVNRIQPETTKTRCFSLNSRLCPGETCSSFVTTTPGV